MTSYVLANFKFRSIKGGGRVMVFSVTFNNISVISLVEETVMLGENHRPVQVALSHNVVSSTPRLSGI